VVRGFVHVPARVVLKCAHACSGAEVVDSAFVEGVGRSRTLVHFHTANWVRKHMIYLPELFGDEVARIRRYDGLRLDPVVRPKMFRAGESRIKTKGYVSEAAHTSTRFSADDKCSLRGYPGGSRLVASVGFGTEFSGSRHSRPTLVRQLASLVRGRAGLGRWDKR
jgi:hypothetical protein